MQYRLPPASAGPSSKTCPRCAPQFLQRTSVRDIPWDLSSRNFICSKLTGSVKLGQPVPESNLVSEEKSSWPQIAQRNIPRSWLSQYLPVNGASVPPSRATLFNSGSSSLSSFIVFLFLPSPGDGEGRERSPRIRYYP